MKSFVFLALLISSIQAKQTLTQPINQPIIRSSDYDYTASIDLSVNRYHVNDGIYGMNFMYDEVPSDAITDGLVGATRSGGGDPTTVYNWRIDADNAGFDWFFQERPRAAPVGGNSMDVFVNTSLAINALAFVDFSTIGWVAKSRDDCFSFPLSKWPNQQRSNGQMGNGNFPNGTQIAKIYGPQRDCYITSVPQDGVDFVTHLVDTFGAKFIKYGVMQLDNEPEWWDLQHVDVHPDPANYDEVWSMTRDWASAIKAKHPDVKISGLVAAGWYGIWCSALDGQGWRCPPSPGPDYLSHNKTYHWPWLLQQLEAHKQSTGVCLIDYLDWHWYPALNNQNDDSNATIAQQMLEQPRGLWDPTYSDLSPFINPINGSSSPAVIRQVWEWANKYHPSCKLELCITEFMFGGAQASTSALALAEVLAIFARERLSVSTLFEDPTNSAPIQQAYRLFRNYDGYRSRVTGDNVQADVQSQSIKQSQNELVQSGYNLFSIYAQHDAASQTLYVKLFQKDPKQTYNVSISVNSIKPTNNKGYGSVWSFSAQPSEKVSISHQKDVSVTFDNNNQGQFDISLPPRTATLVVIRGVSQSQAELEYKISSE